MVESKARKAAFLREVVRALGVTGVHVENERVETIASTRTGSVELVTVRAVRIDAPFSTVIAQLLRPHGLFATFSPAPRHRQLLGFEEIQTTRLLDSKSSYLVVYKRLFHVEQR